MACALIESADVPQRTNVPCVLVADDQSDVVAALRLLLRGAGLDVDPASSVQEVRTRLSAREYDLLLMDLNYARDTTSGQEGLELLSEVHARDGLLPIIAMTGWGNIDTAVEAMRRGARSFVAKPWDNAVLAEAVRKGIEEGRAARGANARASREQEEARAMQRAMLPAALPVVAGCDLARRWEPASAFGGDCYDALRLTDTRVAISIADVCGKGLGAAFLMSNLQASIRAFASSDPTPRQIASNVNRALCQHHELRRFVTLFYGIYDAETRRMTFTNAGHNPPIIARADGSVARMTTGGMVIGVFEEAAYEQAEVQLEAGDRLVLFTDGITEAESSEGSEFGDHRLVQTVLRHAGSSAARLVNGIFDDVSAFTGGRFQDDATVVVVAIQ